MAKYITSLFLSEKHDCIFLIRYKICALCKFSLYLFYMFFTMSLSFEKENIQLQTMYSTTENPLGYFKLKQADLRNYHQYKYHKLLQPCHVFP